MSDYSPFTGRHREPAMPVLTEMLWTVVGPSGTPIVCGLYRRNDARLDLIAHYAAGPDALIRSQLVEDAEKGKALADEWLAATMALGGFTEVKGGGH